MELYTKDSEHKNSNKILSFDNSYYLELLEISQLVFQSIKPSYGKVLSYSLWEKGYCFRKSYLTSIAIFNHDTELLL